MSRTEDFIAKNNNWADYLKDGRLNEKQVSLCMLSDIALSLAQIADSLAMPVYNPSDDLDETINRILGFDKEGE